MLPEILKVKGVPPGIILKRELTRKGLRANHFAEKIGEHPQTLNAIMKQKRRITPALSVKLGIYFGMDAAYFLLLQSYFDIKNFQKNRKLNTPNTEILRKSLFWDTDFEKIDWQNHSIAVIQRVFERGNDAEKSEIERFYGKEKIENALLSNSTKPMKLHKNI